MANAARLPVRHGHKQPPLVHHHHQLRLWRGNDHSPDQFWLHPYPRQSHVCLAETFCFFRLIAGCHIQVSKFSEYIVKGKIYENKEMHVRIFVHNSSRFSWGFLSQICQEILLEDLPKNRQNNFQDFIRISIKYLSKEKYSLNKNVSKTFTEKKWWKYGD